MVKIAKEVFVTEEITLQDGTDVVLKPLPIANLKRFMKRWEDMAGVEDEFEAMDIFVDCAGIALENNFKGKFEALKGSGGESLSEEYRGYLDETLDMDSINQILETCGGIKLNDPKLMEAAEAVLASQAEAGTT